MTDIIDFTKKLEEVVSIENDVDFYMCGECDSTAFFLWDDGSVECALCGCMVENLWVREGFDYDA